MKVYLDSCWIIYLIERNPDWEKPCAERFELADTAGAVFVVSDLVRLECRIQPIRKANKQQEAEYLQFLASLNTCLQLNSEVVELATEIRAHSRLKTPDALHLAAAIHHGCTEFWTNDNRLMQAAVGRIQIINPLT